MEKIGWGQLGIALALSRIIAEASNYTSDDINYGMQRFTVIILSYALLAAAMIPALILLKRCPGENVFSAAARKSKAASRILAVIYLAALLSMMMSACVQTEFYSSSTIFDAAPAWLLIFSVLAACLYGTAKGLHTVVRAGVFAAAGFAVLLLLVISGLWEDIRVERLYPAVAERPGRLAGEVLREFSKNSEAAVFLALCSRVREKAGRGLIVYGGACLFATLLMTFLYNAVLGEYLDVTSFPFYRLASLSSAPLFQRLDGIDAAVWLTSAIIRLCLMAAAAGTAVESAFGSAKAAKLTSALTLTVSAAVGLFFSGHTVDFIKISAIAGTGAVLFAAVTVIPLIGCFFSRGAGKKQAKGAA